MKNLFIFMVSITLFSNAYALTCKSNIKSQQLIEAKIMGNYASLMYEGREYARLALMDIKKQPGFDTYTIRSYKQIGEAGHMLKVRSGGFAGITQAKLYQVTKGGTNLVMNMDSCK